MKEVFQPTDQDSTFTLHLVFCQKDSSETRQPDKEPNAADGNESASSSNSNPTMPHLPNHVNISQFSFNLTSDSSIDYANLYVQQMQQFQQMYVNYMTQLLNQNSLEQPAQSPVSAVGAGGSFPAMSPIITMNPMFFNTFLSVPNLTGFPVISSNLNSTTAPAANDSLGSPPQTENPTESERLNDNQAQNNNENDGEPLNNWLDIFWNTLIFLSLISASFSRSLFVLGVSFIYYLYQSGFFGTLRVRLFGGVLRNEVNDHNLPNNEEQIQQMMDENLEVAGLRRRNVNNQEAVDANAATEPNNQHFVLNKLRFFAMVISSLFSSLMPNGPTNVIPAN